MDEAEALLERAGRRPRAAHVGRGAPARPRSRATSSRTRARSSSRSRCSAAITATTARSRSRPRKLEAPFLTPEEVVAIARAGRATGVQGGAVHPRRPAGGTLRGRARVAGRARVRSTLDYVRAVAISVIEETGLLPHLNPGVMSYEELARLKQVSASMGLMLETSSDRLSSNAEGRTSARPDKVPGRAAADDRGCRPARDPVHDRHPRGDRRDAARARRVGVRDPRAPPSVRAHPGGDRAELPREAGHRDGGTRPSRTTRSSSPRSRRRGS